MARRFFEVLVPLAAALAILDTVPATSQERGLSIGVFAGVQFIEKPYEVRVGSALAVPLIGPLDLYPSIYRYVDPIADYDEVWQLEANLRVTLTDSTSAVMPYLGGGIAVQPAFVPLPGPNPDESFRANVFSVLLAGLEFFPQARSRPVVELHLLGTGADGFPGYGRGEVAILAGLSISLGGKRSSGGS